VVRSARIAVGACSAVAQRLPQFEARLTGARIGDIRPNTDDLAHLTPIDDVRASSAYRRAAALQLVADLLDEAAAAHRGAT
jgi:xanthine dehydrogenase small subunit